VPEAGGAGLNDYLRSLILYQDANLIILDKPAGLAVHGGPRTPVHLEGMLGALQFNLAKPPRLAHRLDRDTSGCLVLARHDKALSRLGRLFGSGKVEKTYWAIVEGCPVGEDGCVNLSLQKVSDMNGWRMIGNPDGQTAATFWHLRGNGNGIAWLELKPRTGRTHQIRVHCASGLASPILGDPVYGGPTSLPLHLHARAVTIPYWADRPPLGAVARPPAHMEAALRECGWSPNSVVDS
jgi:tRNA pseudouridine32 synthase/23S rRNA pseudouridine746 synthase/23S rRNA pseudouridine1911/1915/1917 synthase